MKFLFILTKDSIFDIPWTLQQMNHEVDIFEEAVYDPNLSVEADNLLIHDRLASVNYDYIISYLFIPVIADACHDVRIPYISWTYDSPLVAIFKDSVFHSTNYTFVFDYDEYYRLKSIDVPHVYHLPLAVNLERTGVLNITPEDEKRFSHDISFVGGLYEENNYNNSIHAFPELYQLEIKLYLMKNLCQWNDIRPWPELSDGVTSYMVSTFGADKWNTTDLLSNNMYLGILLLSRKLAEMERVTVLNTLASRFKVDLYTKSNTQHLQSVTVHSGVDYYTDMNKIFYLSKINLNITLPSIETGIPQRILDIMGCGGFVLTNYQAEIEEFFVIGEEIEVFHNIDELVEKCAYYLSHEKERLRIAMNGYKKIREHFTYAVQLQRMLDIVEEDK